MVYAIKHALQHTIQTTRLYNASGASLRALPAVIPQCVVPAPRATALTGAYVWRTAPLENCLYHRSVRRAIVSVLPVWVLCRHVRPANLASYTTKTFRLAQQRARRVTTSWPRPQLVSWSALHRTITQPRNA